MKYTLKTIGTGAALIVVFLSGCKYHNRALDSTEYNFTTHETDITGKDSQNRCRRIPSQKLLEQTIHDVEKDFGITFSSPPTIKCENTIAHPFYGHGTIFYPINNQNQDLDAYQVFRHELGHAYIDQIRPQRADSVQHTINGKETTLLKFIELAPYKDTIDQIIEEGICMYLQKGLREDGKPLDKFEDDLNNVSTSRRYEIGFSLVDPLIDTFGLKAIHYLLQNKPITIRSIKELNAYQQKARSQLIADSNSTK